MSDLGFGDSPFYKVVVVGLCVMNMPLPQERRSPPNPNPTYTQPLSFCPGYTAAICCVDSFILRDPVFRLLICGVDPERMRYMISFKTFIMLSCTKQNSLHQKRLIANHGTCMIGDWDLVVHNQAVIMAGTNKSFYLKRCKVSFVNDVTKIWTISDPLPSSPTMFSFT